MAFFTSHIATGIRGLLIAGIFFLSNLAHAQINISSTPNSVNDTINLCSSGSISFSVNGTGFSSSQWTFSGGSPSTASGNGPHNINFNTPGTYSIQMIAYDTGFPVDTLYRYVVVGTPSTVTFIPPNDSLCISSGATPLGGGSPTGGYYTGTGIVGNDFDPAVAGLGSHKITYHYQSGSCVDTASHIIVVKNAPNSNLSAAGSPILFNGQLTYTRCLPANSTFQFFCNTPSSQYSSYTIDFGDGSTPQTGSVFPSPMLIYSYSGTGVFDVALTLTDSSGCSSTDTIHLFYGGNPAVGLATKGSSVKCLPNDSSGITLWFDVLKWSSNPPGTIYIVETNDGSPPITLNHPPPDSISHTFFEPSCGYNSYSYANAFEIKITAQAPCQPNTTVSVEPIYISDPPTADFEVDPRVCIGQPAFIDDRSWGSANALNGCDTSVLLVWEISPSTFTLNSGYMGTFNGSSNPMNWFGGTDALNVNFQKTGLYTIRQYVGNQAGCEIDTMVQVICVDSIPDPNFGMDKDTICAPDTVTAFYVNNLITFCDTTQLQWEITPATGHHMIGGATDSVLQAYFFASGVYTISIQSNNHCDTSAFLRTLVVQNEPTVTLPNDLVFCGLRELDFSSPAYAPTKYDSLAPLSFDWQVSPATGWNFVNSTNSSSEFAEIDFTTLGTYTIIHTVTNTCGVDSDMMVVRFNEIPVLDSIPDTVLCFNSSFSQVASASLGTPKYNYSWSSTPPGLAHVGDSLFLPSLTSSITIHLMVTDNNDCGDTTSFFIEVKPELEANAGPDQIICYHDTAAILGSASGGVPPYTYRWSPGIKLSSDSTANTLRYPHDSAQSYILTVIDSMGCVDYDTVLIDIFQIQNLDAGPDMALCFDSIIHNMPAASHSGGIWSGPGISGNTFNPIVAGLGIHKIFYNYTDPNGCNYVDSLEINVINIPEAKFSLDNTSGCSVLNIQASDSSSLGVTHAWYANGVLLSTVPNPSFQFQNLSHNQDTTIVVKLVVAAGTGCKDSTSISTTVFPKPLADFSIPREICANDSLIPVQRSIAKAAVSYLWSVSSSIVSISDSSVAQPTFYFPDNQSGTDSLYTIQLIVTSADGCIDTLNQTTTVFSRPTAHFSMPAPTCAPVVVSPSDSSLGTGLNYNWLVSPTVPISSNGTSNPSFHFPASYNDSVVYTIQLGVSNAKGCIDTTTQTYVVYAIPTANFTPSVNDSCGPMTVTFNNLSSANQHGYYLKDISISWDFGNGQTSNDTVPTVTFTNNGLQDTSYFVTLQVINQSGCIDSLIDTITVHPDPLAQINQNYSVDCAPFVIDTSVATAVIHNFANQEYIWSILDLNGTTLATDTGIHSLNYTMLNDGDSIIIRLITTSPFGCKQDTAEALFYTILSPVADFVILPDSGCSPLQVQLFDSSSVGVSHRWYINDSLFSNALNPNFTLLNPSSTVDTTYNVKLVITAGTGCLDSITKTITVFPKPIADFSILNTTCPGDTIQVTNHSSAKGAVYNWSVNSTAVSIDNTNGVNPKFYFPDNQSTFDSTYTISLIVTSADGCTDTISQKITVFSRPTAIFTLPASACSPYSLAPTDSSIANSTLSYSWSITPNVSASGINTASPNFDIPTSFSDSVVYQINLVVVDSNGCSDSSSASYTVYPRPTASFSFSRADSCSPFTVNFINNSSSNQTGMDRTSMSFVWETSTGLSSNDSTPTFTFRNSGIIDSTYFITLIATNAFGCADTIIDSITVHPDPRAVFTTSRSASCAPFVIDSSVVNTSHFAVANQQYYWQLLTNSGSIISQDTGLHNLNYTITSAADSVTLRLITASPFGCAWDTTSQLMYTIPNPIANFSPSVDSACSPMTVNIYDSSSVGANRHWYVNGVHYSTGPAPVFNFQNTSLTNDSTIIIKVVVEAGTGCKDSTERTIVVYPSPVADFTVAVNTCPWDTVSTTNLSLGKIGASYLWSTTSSNAWISNTTVAEPKFVFANNQSGTDSTYSIQLIITSIDGCTDTITKTITLFSRPIADFSLPAAACSPTIISPTNNSSGSNLKFAWYTSSTANISNAAAQSPNISFPLSINDSVVYPITLVLTDSINGCVDSITEYYTVYPKPFANFTISTKDSCGPFTLDFTNLSGTNQTGMNRSTMSFFWDFHDGRTSTDSVPTITYTNIGLQDSTYYITLIATNAFGCSDTLTDSITVHPDPKATIDVRTQADCAPFTIDSTVVTNLHHAGTNASYTWELLDVNTRAVIATFPTSAAINYVLAQPGDSIIVRLTAVSLHLCKSDTIESLLYSIGKAFPGFSPDNNAGCSPLSVKFTDTVPGFTAWEWYANDVLFSTLQHPTHVFTNTSTTQDSVFTIKMIPVSGFGCQDSVMQDITVYALADVSYSAANSCLSDSVAFTNNTQSIHPIVQWSWNFGDGTTDSTEHPMHLFPAAGHYTVSLTATNVHGCSRTYYDTITIYPRPIADFNISSACGLDTLCTDQAVTLNDASSIFTLGGNITQWAWDIDADGSIEYSTQNPQHTFSTTGSFPIRLIVTSQYGCTDTIEKTYFINEIPHPYFNIDSLAECGPFNTTVSDSSYGLIDTYQWQVYVFDTAGTKILLYSTNQQNPNPLPTFLPNYGADTTYYISQTVGNCCGTATYVDSIVLKSMPVPHVLPSVTSGCNPLTVTFQLDGLVKGRPDYLIMNYADGTIDTLNKFFQIAPNNDTIWVWGQQTHTFTNTIVHDTTFHVQVTAINNCGDSTISIPITVHPNNIQAFIEATPDQGCAPLTTTIIDRSYGGTSTTWCLDYDTLTGTCNQPTALGDSFVYTYTTPGTYVIAQFVVDACSADTAYKVITVHPSPIADFSHSGSACEGAMVNFLNLSTTNSNTIAGYTWDFGDGTGTFLASPTHYYQQPGTYNVCLTVISTNGCEDSICKSVTIYSKPEVEFSFQNACFNNQPIAFFDSSSTQTGQILGTIWKFGDGNTSVMPNPQHTYASPGIYTVTLIHTTNFGCEDSTSHVVNVFPISTADFNTTNALGKKCGAPQLISFNNLSSSAAGYYWDFDYNGNRGALTSTLVNPSYLYTIDGAYDVLLVAYNANGCVDSIIKPVYIRPFPMAGFLGDTTEGCAPLTVNFTDTSIYNFNGPGQIVNWVWDFGDGSTFSGSPDVTHTYTDPGRYTVTLFVESDGGCTDTISLNDYIIVHPTPIASFTHAEVNSKTFNFINTSQYVTSGTKYYWTFGDGKTSRERNPEHIYDVDLFENDYLFEVCLYTSNEFGCGDTVCETLNLKGYLLFTPNAFAPDLEGAGMANYFLPSGHSMKEYHLQIFDEWGNIIFESTSIDENGIPNEPWDGKHATKGTDLPMGAYVWKIDAIFNDGTKWDGEDRSKKLRQPYGTVTLIR